MKESVSVYHEIDEMKDMRPPQDELAGPKE